MKILCGFSATIRTSSLVSSAAIRVASSGASSICMGVAYPSAWGCLTHLHGGASPIRMGVPHPSAWGCLTHPHRLTHPFQGVPGIYGVALFAFLLWLNPLAGLSSLLTR